MSSPTSANRDEVNFFISYTESDQEWAEWIGWTLEEAGYSVLLQAWDFGAGARFVTEMHKAAVRASRTIAVLSKAYNSSAFAAEEWQAAWIDDPDGSARRLIVVRVEKCDRPGLLRQIVSIDFFRMDRETARDRLLAEVRCGRRKPLSEPRFPLGEESDAAERFPLVLTGVSSEIEESNIELAPRELPHWTAGQSVRPVVRVDMSAFGAALGTRNIMFHDHLTVSMLLDSVWYEISPLVRAYTYGQSWVLVDTSTGKYFSDLGKRWAKRNLGVATDSRLVRDVGIGPTTPLKVIPIERPKRRWPGGP